MSTMATTCYENITPRSHVILTFLKEPVKLTASELMGWLPWLFYLIVRACDVLSFIRSLARAGVWLVFNGKMVFKNMISLDFRKRV